MVKGVKTIAKKKNKNDEEKIKLWKKIKIFTDEAKSSAKIFVH